MKKIISFLLLVVILLCSCTNKEYNTEELSYFYFDTPISIKIYSYEDVDYTKLNNDIDSMLKEYELTFSTYNKDSLAYKLNQNNSIKGNEMMSDLTSKAINFCNENNGDVDISSGKLIDIWSINNDNNLPTDEQIKDALKTIDCNNVKVDNDTISLTNNSKVDYGAMTKGYVANKLETMLIANGVTSALINLGGNVQLVGTKPDNKEFVVAVMKPEIENVTNDSVLNVTVSDKAVVTSGINQRFFVGEDGTLYHHILDIKTGYPADNDIASVTILTKDGYLADTLSTFIFLQGVDKGLEYIKNKNDVEAIIITRDKKVYLTSNDIKYELLDKSYKIEK